MPNTPIQVTPAVKASYARGKIFVITNTLDANTQQFLRANPQMVFRSIMLDDNGYGILAQPSIQPAVAGQPAPAPLPVVFIPFPIQISAVPPGVAQFGQILPTTPVHDLGRDPVDVLTMNDMLPAFFTEIQEAGTPQQPPRSFGANGQPAPQPGQPAQQQKPFAGEVPDFGRAMPQGTIFTLDFTSNPDLLMYQGWTLQVAKSNSNGMICVPEAKTNIRDAIIIPNDKRQRYTVKPPGDHQFASGLQNGQRAWNPSTRSHVIVDTWYPSYFGSPFVGVPYVLCPWTIPLGYATGLALGCLLDLALCPFGVGYYCDGYYGGVWGPGYGYGYGSFGYGLWYDPWYDPGFGWYGCGYYGDCYAGYYGYDPVFDCYGGYGGFWGYDSIYPGYDTYGAGFGADGSFMIDGGDAFGYGGVDVVDPNFGGGVDVVGGDQFGNGGVDVVGGDQFGNGNDVQFDDQQQGQVDQNYDQNPGNDVQFDDQQQGQVDQGGYDAPDVGGGNDDWGGGGGGGDVSFDN